MGQSIADPTVVLSMLLNQGSVKQAQDQLVSGIRQGIGRTQVEFERLESFLTAAIAKAPIEQQLKRSLDAVSRSMGQSGNFSSAIINEYARIEAAARQAGSAFVEEMAKQGGAVARFGHLQSTGSVDVHPSWAAAKAADWVRRVHVAEHNENMSIEKVDRLNSGQWGQKPPSDMMQRLSSWQQKTEADETKRLDKVYDKHLADTAASQRVQRMIERAGADPQAAFSAMSLGDRDSQGMPIYRRHRDPQDHFASMNLGDRDSQVQRRRNGSPLEQRDVIIKELQETMASSPGGSKGRWANKDNIHRFRFAAQNVGFGIDDAIQSYHYGGIGASIRAASNNVTAIAGMSIPNPAMAAATVVALSVATAALPTILKRYGLDDSKTAAIASLRYQRDPSIRGAMSRGEDTVSKASSAAESYFKLDDESRENHERRLSAHASLAKLKQTYNKDANPLDVQRTIGTFVGGKLGTEYNAALKFLDEDDDTVAGAKMSERVLDLKKLAGNTKSLKAIERASVRSRVIEGRFNQASTIQEYESAIHAQHASDLRLVKESGASPGVIEVKSLQLDVQRNQRLSQKEANQLAVNANVRDRASFMRNELGSYASDPISSAKSSFMSKFDSYHKSLTDKTMSNKDFDTLMGAAGKGYYRDRDRGMRDAMGAAWGGVDVFNDLKNKRDDAMSSYKIGAELNPEEAGNFSKLSKNAQAGFEFQSKRAMEDLQSNFKITSPLGQLADAQKRKAEDLEKLFQDNPDMAPADKKKLDDDFRRSTTLAFREANRPSGTEHFTADSQTVGSRQDRELEARMLGTFVKPDDKNEEAMKKADLAGLKQMLQDIGVNEENLAGTRLNI